jgi:dihydroorotase-like cyclic amidohydrolase
VIDASGCYVLPGIVDPHTHPGNFRPLGPDIASETRSSVGGVTSMLGTVKVTRMANDSPEITRPEDAVTYLDRFDYEGIELTGWPVLTMLRGRVVAEGGQPVGNPIGEYLHRVV